MFAPYTKKVVRLLFFGVAIVIVVGIYQHNYIINLSSKQQDLHKEIAALSTTKNQLSRQYEALFSPATLTHYARTQLGLQALKKTQFISLLNTHKK